MRTRVIGLIALAMLVAPPAQAQGTAGNRLIFCEFGKPSTYREQQGQDSIVCVSLVDRFEFTGARVNRGNCGIRDDFDIVEPDSRSNALGFGGYFRLYYNCYRPLEIEIFSKNFATQKLTFSHPDLN